MRCKEKLHLLYSRSPVHGFSFLFTSWSGKKNEPTNLLHEFARSYVFCTFVVNVYLQKRERERDRGMRARRQVNCQKPAADGSRTRTHWCCRPVPTASDAARGGFSGARADLGPRACPASKTHARNRTVVPAASSVMSNGACTRASCGAITDRSTVTGFLILSRALARRATTTHATQMNEWHVNPADLSRHHSY